MMKIDISLLCCVKKNIHTHTESNFQTLLCVHKCVWWYRFMYPLCAGITGMMCVCALMFLLKVTMSLCYILIDLFVTCDIIKTDCAAFWPNFQSSWILQHYFSIFSQLFSGGFKASATFVPDGLFVAFHLTSLFSSPVFPALFIAALIWFSLFSCFHRLPLS